MVVGPRSEIVCVCEAILLGDPDRRTVFGLDPDGRTRSDLLLANVRTDQTHGFYET